MRDMPEKHFELFCCLKLMIVNDNNRIKSHAVADILYYYTI